MAVCSKCGWWTVACHCKSGSVGVIDHAWVKNGTWEHIDPKQPNMRIESKKQLIEECNKRGLMPKAFLKPKSQGKGWEVR